MAWRLGFTTRRERRAVDPSSPWKKATSSGTNAATKPWRTSSGSPEACPGRGAPGLCHTLEQLGSPVWGHSGLRDGGAIVCGGGGHPEACFGRGAPGPRHKFEQAQTLEGAEYSCMAAPGRLRGSSAETGPTAASRTPRSRGAAVPAPERPPRTQHPDSFGPRSGHRRCGGRCGGRRVTDDK